ncbi:hypothetical protein V7x_10430 [Crateriforma conspicua]|uniref:Uncharacterized protein n=2 Tax=Crateriforma conspicua TaxID=2527996 RepID=A0A5C6FT54_9PLAN|nr:hypothetical protein V7x_10430 [Crateriforma conspicua]
MSTISRCERGSRNDRTPSFVRRRQRHDTKFCVIDANAAKPTVDSLAFPLSDGEAMTTPVATKTRYGQTLAFAVVDQKDAPEKDRLKIIDQEVSRDGSLWVMSLTDFDVLAKLDSGGAPTRVVAVGGP